MSVISGEEEWADREVRLDYLTVAEVGAEALCLITYVHHHLVAIDSLWVAWEILNFCCLCQLSPCLHSAVDDR